MVRVLNIHEDTQVSKHDPYHEVWQVRETPCDDYMEGQISGKASWRREHLSCLKKEVPHNTRVWGQLK